MLNKLKSAAPQKAAANDLSSILHEIIMSLQNSFKNGAVNIFLYRETIDFTDFSGTFQDTV